MIETREAAGRARWKRVPGRRLLDGSRGLNVGGFLRTPAGQEAVCVSLNMLGLACSLLAFCSSGPVCVYEDYQLSSLPGGAGGRVNPW